MKINSTKKKTLQIPLHKIFPAMSTATAANDITPNADVSSGGGIDTSPFLTSPNSQNRRSFRSSPSLQGAAGYLRRASSRRLMREPSMRVREAAAEQIEERQSDWAYSKPIVILDLLWNLAFVIVSITVLVLSRNESPEMPLRLWIIGYALQSVLHMVCVVFEYRHRRLRDSSGNLNSSEQRSGSESWNSGEGNLNSESDRGESGDNSPERNQNNNETSLAKHLESANTMFSFVWWIIGFYWATVGGPNMISDAPLLYWLCITFLAFDVLFVVICVAVACIIGIAVCCCLPCIIAILYAVADQEGATKEDVERLPKYKFKRLGNFEKENGEIQESCGGVMVECDTDTPTEHALTPEDAECCICLCSYEDGIELRELPCRHHFHSACIDKWLYINATCPLCKFNILRHGNQSGSEEA